MYIYIYMSIYTFISLYYLIYPHVISSDFEVYLMTYMLSTLVKFHFTVLVWRYIWCIITVHVKAPRPKNGRSVQQELGPRALP